MIQASSSDPICGTYLSPHREYVLSFVSKLISNSAECSSSKGRSLLESHNAMALYTLEMLMFATGHRAVSDPFFSLELFDASQRFVLIEDKVVSSGHQARIAWLPPLAWQQVALYLSHLRSLSRYIRSNNPDLADQIWAATKRGYPRPISLFFLLTQDDEEIDWKRIKPSSIQTTLGSSWELPLNTNRHLLSTWMHANNCHAEIIDAQLGHTEAGCYAFGIRSPFDPEYIEKYISPFLQKYLEEQGWKTIAGLQAPSRLAAISPSILAKSLNSTTPFGPEARTSIRELTLRKDVEAVLSLFNNSYPSGLPPTIPDEEIDALQDKLFEASPDNRKLIRLSLFRRHLLKLKRAGTMVMVPGRMAVANKESSIFSINSSKDASTFEEIRNQFVAYLGEVSEAPPELEKRIAEIMISACIFGAQSSPNFFDQIERGSIGYLYRLHDEVIADITKSEGSPIRRWFPDELTWALLIGHFTIVNQNTPEPSVEKVRKHLIEILKSLKVLRYKKTSTRQSADELLAPLLHFTRTWWRFRLPGVIRAYAEGEISCASVPLSNWLRLTTGMPGSIEINSSTIAPHKPYDDIPPIQKLQSTSSKQSQLDWNEIKATFGSSNSDEKSKKINARSSTRKKTIESRALALLNNSSVRLSPVAALISAWIIHMCRHGSKNEPDLAASTIATYARTIGPLLIALANDQDILSLPDFEFEEIYRILLETSPRKNLDYVAARLKAFHEFLVDAYGVPSLDWSEVVGEGFLEADAVDAGIVTSDQYVSALNNLLSDQSYNERERLIHSAVLFFAYRFGLRPGEIFRLTISDIILDDHEMVIYIRNSVYGETKTENGVRQLPLIGNLSTEEDRLIRKWLSHVGTYADDDSLAGLLPKLSTQRNIVDRSACINAVVKSLRTSTGDSQTRLRHLRHTCATRLFLSMMLDEIPTGFLGSLYNTLWGDITPQQVRKLLIGDSRMSRRGLYAMALYMGHGSPDTTHRHYVHLADILLKQHVSKESLQFNSKVAAYAFQTSSGNIRQLRSRKGKEYSFRSMAEYFTHRSTIPTPSLLDYTLINATNMPDVVNIDAALTPADIDRLLLLSTMRDSLEGLADRFLTTDHVVESTLRVASLLQEQSGFTDFSIPLTHSDDHWVPVSTQRLRTLEKESSRVRRFLGRIDKLGMDYEKLNAAARIWLDSYHPHANFLLISKRSDLQAFLEAMELLGIPTSDFDAILPEVQRNDEADYWLAAQNWLSSIGLQVSQVERLPLNYSKLRSDNRIGIILRASDSHLLGFQRTLNRTLFIMSIWLKQRR